MLERNTVKAPGFELSQDVIVNIEENIIKSICSANLRDRKQIVKVKTMISQNK